MWYGLLMYLVNNLHIQFTFFQVYNWRAFSVVTYLQFQMIFTTLRRNPTFLRHPSSFPLVLVWNHSLLCDSVNMSLINRIPGQVVSVSGLLYLDLPGWWDENKLKERHQWGDGCQHSMTRKGLYEDRYVLRGIGWGEGTGRGIWEKGKAGDTPRFLEGGSWHQPPSTRDLEEQVGKNARGWILK